MYEMCFYEKSNLDPFIEKSDRDLELTKRYATKKLNKHYWECRIKKDNVVVAYRGRTKSKKLTKWYTYEKFT